MEKKDKNGNLPSSLWILVLTVITFAPVVYAIDDKCGACRAVAVLSFSLLFSSVSSFQTYFVQLFVNLG
jgi:hypothetical protein